MNSKLFLIICGGLLLACGPSKKLTTDNTINHDNTVHLQGLEVIRKSDCYTCHSLDNKLIGPSFLQIARKYELNEKNTDILSKKIISGGSGVWNNIPMTPHSALTDSDIKEAVKYILSLKK